MARAALSAMGPELLERVIQAASYQVGRLYDPIEDDPECEAFIASARWEAAEAARAAGIEGRGSCHFVWTEQAKVLRERDGVIWFSPKEMNPHVTYD